MSFTLIKETVELYEEKQLLESIELFEDVARAMQPYVAILNNAADGQLNPFDPADKNNKKPIPVDNFAAFMAGLKVLLDRETRRNAYAEDFGSTKKDLEFLSHVGKPVKKFGEDGNQTAQQRIIEIGKSAKNIWDEFKTKISKWPDENVRQKFVNEVKKIVNEWDKQLNQIKTEFNKKVVAKA